MIWFPFFHGRKGYSLDHLHPVTITYIQEAKGDKPARSYTVDVAYSLHCFTRGIQDGESIGPDLCYSDDRETRAFDFRRYWLSHQLPEIVEGLSKRKVNHSGKGNYFTIETVDHQTGAKLEYEIYFAVSRSSRKGRINLFVQSAYVRDPQHLANRPKLKPIGFSIILFNVLNRVEIKIPN